MASVVRFRPQLALGLLSISLAGLAACGSQPEGGASVARVSPGPSNGNGAAAGGDTAGEEPGAAAEGGDSVASNPSMGSGASLEGPENVAFDSTQRAAGEGSSADDGSMSAAADDGMLDEDAPADEQAPPPPVAPDNPFGTRNLFTSVLQIPVQEVEDKVELAVNRFFGIGTGEPNQPIVNGGYRDYYELPQNPNQAFIWAADSNDVRSEGMCQRLRPAQRSRCLSQV